MSDKFTHLQGNQNYLAGLVKTILKNKNLDSIIMVTVEPSRATIPY